MDGAPQTAIYDTMRTIFRSINWKGFGGESTFIWSLGLWPFKDTFYSNSSSRVRNAFAEDFGGFESMPFTHSLVSALSGGGFTPGLFLFIRAFSPSITFYRHG